MADSIRNLQELFKNLREKAERSNQTQDWSSTKKTFGLDDEGLNSLRYSGKHDAAPEISQDIIDQLYNSMKVTSTPVPPSIQNVSTNSNLSSKLNIPSSLSTAGNFSPANQYQAQEVDAVNKMLFSMPGAANQTGAEKETSALETETAEKYLQNMDKQLAEIIRLLGDGKNGGAGGGSGGIGLALAGAGAGGGGGAGGGFGDIVKGLLGLAGIGLVESIATAIVPAIVGFFAGQSGPGAAASMRSAGNILADTSRTFATDAVRDFNASEAGLKTRFTNTYNDLKKNASGMSQREIRNAQEDLEHLAGDSATANSWKSTLDADKSLLDSGEHAQVALHNLTTQMRLPSFNPISSIRTMGNKFFGMGQNLLQGRVRVGATGGTETDAAAGDMLEEGSAFGRLSKLGQTAGKWLGIGAIAGQTYTSFLEGREGVNEFGQGDIGGGLSHMGEAVAGEGSVIATGAHQLQALRALRAGMPFAAKGVARLAPALNIGLGIAESASDIHDAMYADAHGNSRLSGNLNARAGMRGAAMGVGAIFGGVGAGYGGMAFDLADTAYEHSDVIGKDLHKMQNFENQHLPSALNKWKYAIPVAGEALAMRDAALPGIDLLNKNKGAIEENAQSAFHSAQDTMNNPGAKIGMLAGPGPIGQLLGGMAWNGINSLISPPKETPASSALHSLPNAGSGPQVPHAPGGNAPQLHMNNQITINSNKGDDTKQQVLLAMEELRKKSGLSNPTKRTYSNDNPTNNTFMDWVDSILHIGQ